jgi:hypothetical protein
MLSILAARWAAPLNEGMMTDTRFSLIIRNLVAKVRISERNTKGKHVFLFISERKCSSTEGQDTFFSLNNLLDTEKKSNFVENFSE